MGNIKRTHIEFAIKILFGICLILFLKSVYDNLLEIGLIMLLYYINVIVLGVFTTYKIGEDLLGIKKQKRSVIGFLKIIYSYLIIGFNRVFIFFSDLILLVFELNGVKYVKKLNKYFYVAYIFFVYIILNYVFWGTNNNMSDIQTIVDYRASGALNTKNFFATIVQYYDFQMFLIDILKYFLFIALISGLFRTNVVEMDITNFVNEFEEENLINETDIKNNKFDFKDILKEILKTLLDSIKVFFNKFNIDNISTKVILITSFILFFVLSYFAVVFGVDLTFMGGDNFDLSQLIPLEDMAYIVIKYLVVFLSCKAFINVADIIVEHLPEDMSEAIFSKSSDLYDVAEEKMQENDIRAEEHIREYADDYDDYDDNDNFKYENYNNGEDDYKEFIKDITKEYIWPSKGSHGGFDIVGSNHFGSMGSDEDAELTINEGRYKNVIERVKNNIDICINFKSIANLEVTEEVLKLNVLDQFEENFINLNRREIEELHSKIVQIVDQIFEEYIDDYIESYVEEYSRLTDYRIDELQMELKNLIYSKINNL